MPPPTEVLDIHGHCWFDKNFMVFHRQIMENASSTNISNSFHDSRNYGSAPQGISLFHEVLRALGSDNSGFRVLEFRV